MSQTLQEAIEADRENGTYRVPRLRCGNCRWWDTSNWGLPIPQGQSVAETACPNCGCKSLTKGL